MTFTYDPTLSNAVSRIRFKIGDTDTAGGILPTGRHFSDEEIAAVLAQKGDEVEAAIALIDSAISAWSRVGSIRVGPQSMTSMFTVKNLREVRAQLEAEASGVAENGAIAVHWKRVDGWSPEDE